MRGIAALVSLSLLCPALAAAQPSGRLVPGGCFELPVTGGQAVIERLGIRPEELGATLVLLARALHGVNSSAAAASLAVTFTEIFGPVTVAAPLPVAEGPDAHVLAPFDAAVWRRALQLDAEADLFASIVKRRGALLVAAGALEAGDGIREWLARDARLLQEMVDTWPGSFVLAGPALALDDGRLTVPGGAGYDAAWTALVGAPPTSPDAFLRRLVARDRGRLARFFATLARLDDARLAALVAPLPGEDQAAALAAVYSRARNAEAPWDANDHPFQLSYADLPSILHGLHDLPVDRLPASAGRWPFLLSAGIESRAHAASLLRRPPAAPAFASLVRAMLDGAPRTRRDHISVVSLARQVWAEAGSPEAEVEAVYALGHFERYRALLLTLDRLNVHDPGIWGRAVDAARRVDAGSGREERLGAFQGALALVERTARAGSLSEPATSAMIRALTAAVDSERSTPRAVAAWLVDEFIPALPRLVRPDRFSGATAYESRLLQALAGPPAPDPPVLSWEGLDYAVDVTAAEHERILRIRALLPTPGLDAALAADDDGTLVAALRALAYAPALGDPDGNVTLSPDVVTRHDFGGSRVSPGRDFAWLPAQERSGAGNPWHVAGSLLGLDLALARSALRRLSLDDMPPVPSVNLNDQITLARTAVALRPGGFTDAARDELAAAIARGRARVAAAQGDTAALLALGSEVAMTTVTRRTLGWTLAATPTLPAAFFSLRDLLWLGRPNVAAAELAAWGVMGDAVNGRLVPRFSTPAPWDHLAGRPDTGILATQVPDLTLRLVEVTAERRLPAVLIPALLLYATQDYWHEVEARFADDWQAMARGAVALPADRVEDYVAALGSAGPLRPR